MKFGFMVFLGCSIFIIALGLLLCLFDSKIYSFSHKGAGTLPLSGWHVIFIGGIMAILGLWMHLEVRKHEKREKLQNEENDQITKNKL